MTSLLLPETQRVLHAAVKAGPTGTLKANADVWHNEHSCPPFALMPRTDGKFAVIDTRRPWNDQVVEVVELTEPKAHKRMVEVAMADAGVRVIGRLLGWCS